MAARTSQKNGSSRGGNKYVKWKVVWKEGESRWWFLYAGGIKRETEGRKEERKGEWEGDPIDIGINNR